MYAWRRGKWLNEKFKKLKEKTSKNPPVRSETMPHPSKNLLSNTLIQTFANCSDFKIRQFLVGTKTKFVGYLFFFDTLVDVDRIDESILQPLLMHQETFEFERDEKNFLQTLSQCTLSHAKLSMSQDLTHITQEILNGNIVLQMENFSEAILLDCGLDQKRTITEPLMESVNRGPRDGFTEHLNTNLNLIRYRLKDPLLQVEHITLGKRTRSQIALVYLKDLADASIHEKILQKLSQTSYEGILESSYIEEALESSPWTLFPETDHTERPDKTVACLLEGRFVILTQGTPIALIIPSLFVQFFQSAEDYYQRSVFSSFIRLFRYFSSFLTIALPSIYISLATYHAQFLPSKFIILFMNGRSDLPFPATLEVLIMLLISDLIQESSSRLLGRIGQAAGIVGSIILGQAAIASNIAAPLTVVIISVTLLSSYVLPRYAMEYTFRILRYLLIVAATILGIYGIGLFLLCVLIHLASIESMGIPYLAPITPSHPSYLKDTFIRSPLKTNRSPLHFLKFKSRSKSQ